MNKRIGFLIGVCVVLLPVVSTGCARAQVKKTIMVSILPEDCYSRYLVDMIFSRYRGYTWGGFEEVISQDFVPNRKEFLNTVAGKAYASRVLELNYMIEKSLRTGDQVSIDFTWKKKEAPGVSESVKMVSGRSEFVFKKSRRGWGLLQMSGDDPF
jgi:hypothetical protein